jgi:hypothetical protein
MKGTPPEAQFDPGLDALLDLHGLVMVVDQAGRYWVKFVVNRVARSPERPHGLDYSLTLHDSRGRRLVGFDNAHPVRRSAGPGGKKSGRLDHLHRMDLVRQVEFRSATELVESFWREVDHVLKERGVIR